MLIRVFTGFSHCVRRGAWDCLRNCRKSLKFWGLEKSWEILGNRSPDNCWEFLENLAKTRGSRELLGNLGKSRGFPGIPRKFQGIMNNPEIHKKS